MVKASWGGEPVKGELMEQYQKYKELMKFNGKPRASLGLWGSMMEGFNSKRRWEEYLRWK